MGLAVHGHQVDHIERQCYLEVLEVPVTLPGLVNQDGPGTQEAPLSPFLGALAPLCFLSSRASRGLLGGQALMIQGFQELQGDH